MILDLLNPPPIAQVPGPPRSRYQPVLLPELMSKKRPSTDSDAHDGRVHGLVRRAAAVPVALVRRLDSAGARGLPVQRRVPRGRRAGDRGPGRDLGRDRRARGQRRARPSNRPVASRDRDRQAVRAAAGRHAGDPARRRRCWARPSSSSRPATRSGPKLPDDGTLPQAQVSPTVQLDQIFSTFDPTTRRAFQTWMQQGAIALTNRGEQFNAAFADLYPFATNVESVLAVLHRQGAATSDAAARRRPGVLGAEPLAVCSCRRSSATTTRCSPPPPPATWRWPRRSRRSRRSSPSHRSTIDS